MAKPTTKFTFCPEHGLQFFDAQSRTCEHIPHKENSMETTNRVHPKVAKMSLSPADSVEVSSLVGQAFRAGLAEQADPLAGYANLTEAISAGEPIEYEKLDGLKVQCVNPSLGGLRGTLKRNKAYASDHFHGWDDDMNLIYTRALWHSWLGLHNWTLWVEGEVPLARKTADQLEIGTYFLSKFEEGMEHLVYVGSRAGSGEKTIYYAPEMTKSYSPPYKWVVLEEYGTFQKPEGK